jgi:hypothetical protein
MQTFPSKISALVGTWLLRPFLVLLAARFVYLFVQVTFKVDPGLRLANAVLGTPSHSWIDIGRWAVLGIPALIPFALYEVLRSPRFEVAIESVGSHRDRVVFKAKERKIFPDRSIRHAFLHIHPAPFQTFHEKERVGNQLIDKFSSGALSAWGREIVGANHMALAEIPKEVWRSPRFTYWFLDETEPNRHICHVECDAPQRKGAPRLYSDLQVNSVQLESVWPG